MRNVEDSAKSRGERTSVRVEIGEGTSRQLVSARRRPPHFYFYATGLFCCCSIVSYRKFVSEKLPELRMLNQLTFFSIEELNDKFETPSAVHVLYGDCKSSNVRA